MLRPNQIDALARINYAYEQGFVAPILVAATGFGKTHCAAEVIQQWNQKGKTVWFLAHIRELLDDTSKRLKKRGIAYSWVRPKSFYNKNSLCQLVSLHSAVRRLGDLKRPDLIIIDECDLAIANSYQRIIEFMQRPLILGLTGTPIRSDGQSMRSGGFDLLIKTRDTIDLIEEKCLSGLKMWSFNAPPDLERVKDRGGDYDGHAAGDIMARPVQLANSLAEWRRLCVGADGRIRPTAVFCSSVRAAVATAEEWQAAGFRAMAVHGESSQAEREEALDGLRHGRLDAVMSADMWIAGVDVDCIACILCLRITKSLRIWLQMVGRGLRKCDEWKDCYLLDCVGNILRLDSPLKRRMDLWSLDENHISISKQAAISIAVCQRCRSCDVVAKKCKECGHVQEVRLPHGPLLVKGELMEIDPRKAIKEQEKNRKKQEERNCKDMSDFVALGRARNYSNPEGWAYHKIKLRQRWRSFAS